MKVKALSLSIGLILAVPLSANAQMDMSAIEARLNALEQRAAAAEARAAVAEQKAERLEQLVATQNQGTKKSQIIEGGTTAKMEQRIALLEKQSDDAQAKATLAQNQLSEIQKQSAITSNDKDGAGFFSTNTDWGNLKLYGDIEYNIDAASKKGQLTSMHSMAGNNNDFGDKERWDLNGRILIGIDGERELRNGNYAGFSVQPMADMTGSMNVDDAVFYFGQKDKWEYKIGRYEAYDMFPLNQDTFVEYSGNTANDLYGDGFGYIYMMKEGRGRSSDGGSMMVNTHYNNWYFELNALVEDGTSVFKDGEYHGRKLDNRKNVIYMRPVVAWQKDNFTVAAAVDANVINNAYGYEEDGQFYDQSRRTGYGLTMKWDTLANDPINGFVANLSTAYLDANEENDLSIGGNILWRKFQLGYIYAHNDIKKYYQKESGTDEAYLALNPGKYNINTVFASYELPNVLDMDNFKTYLGAYYSHIDGKDEINVHSSDKDRYGARVRFKYFF
ncbi:carbohydrate porin [Proteus myxofaciens]|uniref:Putative glycoporin n=1 Tax=Proteus myxofaciens ATCC 19692 TaxID=1354337 RepID=A0A198GQL8_9GAMM|nr:carbohydrate porin [Proteus myxofaciens]OAT39165.1 putative glycoporin [Proteus myxofaciens ATCC 19692]